MRENILKTQFCLYLLLSSNLIVIKTGFRLPNMDLRDDLISKGRYFRDDPWNLCPRVSYSLDSLQL